MTSISAIATAINELAPDHPIGKLQELRTKMKQLKRTASVIFDISRKSVNEKEGWAFHTGGREEIQFNIGIERKQDRFRFGVAFSLEPSRSLHDIAPLLPKIERFNEFVRNNFEALDPFRMWVWRKNEIIKTDLPEFQAESCCLFRARRMTLPSLKGRLWERWGWTIGSCICARRCWITGRRRSCAIRRATTVCALQR